MNLLKCCKIWLGGHVPSNVAHEPPEDLEPITKIGATVLFAAGVAALNWGIATWTFAASAPTQARFAISAIAVLMGVGMVLVFDRTFIYFTDTAEDQGSLKQIIYAAFRVLVILAVGSFTAQAVMPLILGNELRTHALHMVENAEKARTLELGERYGVAEKEAALKSAEEGVEKLRQAATTLPPDIQFRLKRAHECWTEHRERRSALRSAGYSASEARDKLAGKAAQCARASQSANAEREAYFARARFQLDHGVTRQQAVETDLSETNNALKGRIEHAREIESANVNELSSTVLWDLISHDPGALMKWGAFNLVILIFELLPLFQKFQSGSSNIGRRRATNRTINRIEIAEHLKQREHDFAISSAINTVSIQAVEEVLSNPDVRSQFAQVFAAYIPAYAPVEAVRAMMREFEVRHVDVEDFMRRYPRYAPIISQAWSQAVKDTTELLASGLYSHPT